MGLIRPLTQAGLDDGLPSLLDDGDFLKAKKAAKSCEN
jgi:hypothetical protein